MNNDIKQLGLDILRDIYGSSRRLTLYPLGHPITQETLKKPLNGLNSIYTFKHSFTIELFRDRLFAEGILLEDTIFVTGFALEMKRHRLSNAVFKSSLSIGDLYHFLSVLSGKPGPFEDHVSRLLTGHGVTGVAVNVSNPSKLFHFEDAGRLHLQKFVLSERIDELIGEKPGIIGSYYMGRLKSDEDIEKELGVDFRLSFLSKYFREVLLHLERAKAESLIEESVLSTDWLDDSSESAAVLGLKRLFEDYLTENSGEEVLASIYRLLRKVGAPEFLMSQILTKSSMLKLKTLQESEAIIETLKYSEPASVDPAGLKKTVFKLAASQQNNFLGELLAQLIKSLTVSEAVQRQKAVGLVATAAEVLVNAGFHDEYNQICKEAVRLSLTPSETIEPVELMSNLIWLAVRNNRWHEFKVLIRTLRGVCDDPTQPDDKRMAASDKLMQISASDVLYETASNLSEKGKSDECHDFFEGLSALGSTEVIRMLAGKITHPDINVRSRMVKLLVSMKKDAAQVLIAKLNEMIERNSGGAIKEDEWHYFRNILRVLREIKAGEAVPYLETIASWHDSRLRLEVVKTLEGMPPESSSALLGKLSRDEAPEIRKAAVVAMGFSGDPCMISNLREVFSRERDCRLAAVASLGRIGDPRARDMLIDLYDASELFKELEISRREADEIKATIIKALTAIGDELSMSKIAEFNFKAPDKSLFKRDLLSSTAKTILYGKNR